MAEVKPFKGLLYNDSKIDGDHSRVIAPPYDIISESQRDNLYEKSGFNIIKLILGKDLEGDTSGFNKYTRAKDLLEQWQEEGVLTRDEEEAFYIYLQEYKNKGKECHRIGFIGLMKIEEAAGDSLLPHEHTLAKPKEDRMNLIKQVKSNLSPIFSLYYDEEGKMKEILEERAGAIDPVIDITVNGERHVLWRLTDKEFIGQIMTWINGENLFIADGHHRYEVARLYRDIRREGDGYDGSADYVMMYFTDMADLSNITIMGTHRVIKVMPTEDKDEIIKKLNEYFDLTEYPDLSALMESLEKEIGTGHVFGFFNGEKYMLMKPKDDKTLLGRIKDDNSEDWKNLDVSVLHSAVFDNILSVNWKEGNLTHVKLPEEAETLIKDGSHVAAFFLNPTRVEQMKAVAERGEMMPQKSTYFYPKLLTGLVINEFEKQRVTSSE